MGIGTSKGAFYDDEFHYAQSQWDPKYDNNVITPEQQKTNKALDEAELDPSTGLGIEIGNKNVMPFPDNKDSNTDFNTRFGNLPPSGILNDLKKPDGNSVPLVRKISDVIDYSDVGNTPLYNGDLPVSKKDNDTVKGYQDWLSKNNLKDKDRFDYDIQGAYMAGINPSENGHLPDTFKKPNHPTFSEESMYHGATETYKDDPDYITEGGYWEKDGSKWNFTPGKSNLDHHSTQDLIDYFKKYEPDSRLILPGS